MPDTMISIPVDATLEARATQVLNRIGLTPEAAVRMLFIHLADQGSLPDALKTPNALTRKALTDADAVIRKRLHETSPMRMNEAEAKDLCHDGEEGHGADEDGHG